MLKVLFIGDIVGKIGRETVKKLLPGLKKEFKPDLVIANAENVAHGSGINKNSLVELREAGVDWFTNGDHAFDREKQIIECFKDKMPLIRPANYPMGVPGSGYAVIELPSAIVGGKSDKVLLINLVGRVFMGPNFDCPFRKLDEILAYPNLASEKFSAIIIDIHAEASAEKITLRHYANGRVSAVLGTHTHVMTADQQITDKGTAYISDVGMVGAADGCIGVDKENPIKTILTQIKHKHVLPEKGKTILNAVLITFNTKTAEATNIKPITRYSLIE